jgi:carnosine N-methyltransferase
LRCLARHSLLEGVAEREESHRPVMEALQKEFGHLKGKERSKVLVPGCGLSRLVYNLCLEGFNVDSNEISHHQLLASQFILQHREDEGQFTLFHGFKAFPTISVAMISFRKSQHPMSIAA